MNKRRARILLSLLLIAGIGAALCLSVRREPFLLERATRVADASHWDASIPYQWISSHEVLYSRDSAPATGDLAFYKRDLLTGQETSLPALSRLVQNSFYKHSFFTISPNGKRLCWTGHGITVATLDGQQSFRINAKQTENDFPSVFWMADSHRLIAYSHDSEGGWITSGTLYDVDAHGATQHLPAAPDTFGDAVAKNGRLLSVVWQFIKAIDLPQTVEIRQSEVGKETLPLRIYTFNLPHPSSREEAVFSPQGDQIVWHLSEPDAPLPPIYAWVYRLIPAFNPPQPPPKVSLWISRIDGSAMHEIGYIPLLLDPLSNSANWDEELKEVAWLPDGKRLSFRHKDGLYTVPVD